MKKLITNIFSFVVLCLLGSTIFGCNNPQSSSNTSQKEIIKTADIPKDTIIKIIKDIADYMAVTTDLNDSGMLEVLKPYQHNYIIGINTTILDDTISKIHIVGSFDKNPIDSLQSITIYSNNDINKSWLKFNDLDKSFGKKEDGVFDKNFHLPLKIDYCAIYTLKTPKNIPIYMLVKASHADDDYNLNLIELKKEKKFYPLKNS